MLLLGVAELIAWGGARLLVVEEDLAHADALVVLSGSSAYVERARWAAQLFKEGRAPLVILTNDANRSGWSTTERRNPFFVERATEELLRAGVSLESIEVLPQPVSDTYSEARQLQHYASAHGTRSLLVVTSAYHSRRALWTLRQVFAGTGVKIGLNAAPPIHSPPSTWWLSYGGWRDVPGEYFKIIYYKVRFA